MAQPRSLPVAFFTPSFVPLPLGCLPTRAEGYPTRPLGGGHRVSQTGPLWPLGPVWLDQARTPTEFYPSSFPPVAGPPRCRPPVIPAGWWTMPPPGPPFRSQAPAPRPSHPPHRRPRRGRTPQRDQGTSPEFLRRLSNRVAAPHRD